MLRTGGRLLLRSAFATQLIGHEASTSGRFSMDVVPHCRRYSSGIGQLVDHEKGKTRFDGFYAGGFYVNNVQVPGSVLATAEMYLVWRPRTLADVTPSSLVLLELLKPPPEVLVLGCGASAAQLSPEVKKYLEDAQIKVEVLDSRNATGYFNILSDEGRSVVGALLVMDPTAAVPENMPPEQEPLWLRQQLTRSRGLV